VLQSVFYGRRIDICLRLQHYNPQDGFSLMAVPAMTQLEDSQF
jgi:hypothetical protein